MRAEYFFSWLSGCALVAHLSVLTPGLVGQELVQRQFQSNEQAANPVEIEIPATSFPTEPDLRSPGIFAGNAKSKSIFIDGINLATGTGLDRSSVQSFRRNTTALPAPESVTADAGIRELQSLVAMESQIHKIIPSLLPCVVSVDGGSGVIVSSDGYILTASHVTKKAGRSVNVQMFDGRVVRATTLGTNSNNDTAALRLNSPGPWPFVKMSDSTLVQQGDWCIALGYPLSFPRGKPAAVRIGRVLEINVAEFVTDCPIMGGDSGGPLLNLNGNLIGISSRVKNDITKNVHVPNQVFQDDWKNLISSIDFKKNDDLNDNSRAYLGVFGETDFNRVRIRSVFRGSPAESAGLLAEDVILQLDGQPVGTFDDVLDFLDRQRPGAKVVATLNRFGKLLDVSIELGKK